MSCLKLSHPLFSETVRRLYKAFPYAQLYSTPSPASLAWSVSVSNTVTHNCCPKCRSTVSSFLKSWQFDMTMPCNKYCSQQPCHWKRLYGRQELYTCLLTHNQSVLFPKALAVGLWVVAPNQKWLPPCVYGDQCHCSLQILVVAFLYSLIAVGGSHTSAARRHSARTLIDRSTRLLWPVGRSCLCNCCRSGKYHGPLLLSRYIRLWMSPALRMGECGPRFPSSRKITAFLIFACAPP